MSERVLDYPLTEAKAETVDGPRETPVNVVTEAKGSIVNTITVDETKSMIEKSEKGGVGKTVSADEIDSESATNGQVLTANGSGAATWKDVPSEVVRFTKTGQSVISGSNKGKYEFTITADEFARAQTNASIQLTVTLPQQFFVTLRKTEEFTSGTTRYIVFNSKDYVAFFQKRTYSSSTVYSGIIQPLFWWRVEGDYDGDAASAAVYYEVPAGYIPELIIFYNANYTPTYDFIEFYTNPGDDTSFIEVNDSNGDKIGTAHLSAYEIRAKNMDSNVNRLATGFISISAPSQQQIDWSDDVAVIITFKQAIPTNYFNFAV